MGVYFWQDVPVVPVTTPWIYHSASLWLISLSSDWSTWLTIADKNLWATQVFNKWDAYTAANCGYYYQWWNNYWFPRSWTVTTLRWQVNAGSYWPWNYYSSSTFRTWQSSYWQYWWDSSWNANLWWAETNTNAAMRWPCPEWFHICYVWMELLRVIHNLGIGGNITDNTTTGQISAPIPDLQELIKLPYAWRRDDEDWTTNSQGTRGEYRQAKANNTTHYRLEYKDNQCGVFAPSDQYNSCFWFSIRPFKDTPVQPDTWWTVLYQ